MYPRRMEFLKIDGHYTTTKKLIFFHKIVRPTVRKKCSSDWEKLLKFEAKGQEFSKILRSLESERSIQFFKQNIF